MHSVQCGSTIIQCDIQMGAAKFEIVDIFQHHRNKKPWYRRLPKQALISILWNIYIFIYPITSLQNCLKPKILETMRFVVLLGIAIIAVQSSSGKFLKNAVITTLAKSHGS